MLLQTVEADGSTSNRNKHLLQYNIYMQSACVTSGSTCLMQFVQRSPQLGRRARHQRRRLKSKHSDEVEEVRVPAQLECKPCGIENKQNYGYQEQKERTALMHEPHFPSTGTCKPQYSYMLRSSLQIMLFTLPFCHFFGYFIFPCFPFTLHLQLGKIKRREAFNTYLTRVCRHRWSRKRMVKIDEIRAFSQHCGFHTLPFF